MINIQGTSDASELMIIADKLLADKLMTDQEHDELTAALKDYIFELNRSAHKLPKITCAGIYNSGKSSVLNALTDSDHFAVGDIPTTASIDEYEHNGFLYVDTPGLNANNFDNETAQKAFKDADVILFVTNMLSGGLSAAEADYLKKLAEILGGTDNLKEQTIFAMSNLHQVSKDSVDEIINEHSKSIESTLGFKPKKIISFDSVTYWEGKRSGSDQLISASGLNNLKAEIISVENNVSKQSNEIAAVRLSAKASTLENALRNVISPFENKIKNLSDQAKLQIIDKKSVKAAIEKCTETVAKKMDLITPPYITDIYTHTISWWELNRGETSIYNAKSEFSCRNKAKDILKVAYNNRERELDEKACSFAKCITGTINNQDKYRDETIQITTDAIIECNNILKEVGIIISKDLLKPIDIPLPFKIINASDIIREFKDDVIRYDGYYRVEKYLSMYCDINEDEIFDHTNIFGKDVYEYKYSCHCSDAIRNMAEDMNENIKSNAQSIIANINHMYSPFCSELKSKLDLRFTAIIYEAESISKSAGSDIDTEIDKLQKEVESLKKYIN